MKKSIFLFFAAILCAFSMNVQSANTMRIYCKQAQSWWKSDGAAVGAHYWGTAGDGTTWPGKRMTKVSGQTDLWYIDVDIDKYQKIIFTRVNGSGSVSDWGAKTGDLTIANTTNQYTISSSSAVWGDPGVKGSWGTYKPTSTAALATSAANIFVGGQATLTSSLTSNASANTIKETTYAISPAGANVSGNTFTATAEGTYTVEATVTYYPLGCPTLTSTATATTTIVAEVPAEEVHDVTVSYMCGETKLQDPTTVNTVGVEKSVKVTAPEIAKYTFANWTLGADIVTTDDLTSNEINITTKAGGSDFTLTANYEKAKLTYTVTVPAGTENCYLVGAMNGWDEKNPYEMTKQGENVFTTTLEGVATTDEYKYLSQKGTWDYEEVGGNRTWSANDVVTAWKDPLETGLYLRGSMNGWGTTDHLKKATKEATTATVTIALEANTDYTLKVAKSDWSEEYGTGSFTATATVKLTSKGGNVSLKTTVAGDYTFTWEMSTSKLTVTYPTLYAVTATANDAAMGTIAGAGEYGKGSTATLTATPNDGYLFVNWTKGGVEVATTQEYSFEVTEAVELVANFEAAAEEVHNVTVSYVCGGNKIADDQIVAAVGETTAKTVEAPAIFGYTFASWTLGAGVTSADATANSISINIVAGASDYTLTANYTEIPKVKVYVVNNKKWSKINVYGWKEGEAQGTPGWPGQEITVNLETEKVAGFDVYSYSVVPGSYDNLILNNGSGEQTGTYKWTDGKYYYVGATENYAGGTAEEVATALGSIVTFDYYIVGSMNEWNQSSADYGMTDDNEDGIYEKTLTLKNNDEFKVKGTDWYGFEKVEGTYKEASENSGNIKLTLGADTEVTVKFNSETKKITFDGLTPEAVVKYDYYVIGTVNEWGLKDAAYGMELNGDIYEKEVTLAIGTHELKVNNGTWDDGCHWGFGDLSVNYEGVEEGKNGEGNPNGNIKITLAAEQTITVKFGKNTKKITLDGLTEKTPVEDYYTIVGATAITGVNWDLANEDNKMTKSGEVYTLTKTDLQLEAGDYEYKVAKNGAWNNGQYPAEGNQKVTIAENGVYTIVYTYTVGTSLTAEPTKTGDYTPDKPVYTVAGDAALCGTNWKADDTTNDMTDNGDGTFTWTKTGVKLTGDAGFKVVKNHDFEVAYPADNWVIKIADYDGAAIYTVTITFTESSTDIVVTLTKTGDAAPAVVTYVLMGVNGDWDNGIALTQNPGNEDEYVLTNQVIFKATDAVKVVTLTDGEATAWCGNVDSYSNATYSADDQGNIVLEDGIYTFYFKKTANNIYINQTGYARKVTSGNFGTICLPYEGTISNATLFVLSYKDANYVYVDEVVGTTLVAGTPYLFLPTTTEISVTYTDDTEATTAGSNGALHGTYVEMDNDDLLGKYVISNNKYYLIDDAYGNSKLPANRAYFNLNELEPVAPVLAPGARRIALGTNGQNTTTGVENVDASAQPVKTIINGQLYILRGEKMYDAQGKLVK